MMRIICSLLLALFAAVVATNDKKIVCYFSSWAIYRKGNSYTEISEIDPTLCTHLIYTFIGITENGGINLLDGWAHLPPPSGRDGFGLVNQLRDRSPNLKTLVAVGGWGEGSIKYSNVVKNPALRKNLVDNLVNFVKQYEFNGLDFDWEYPNQRDGDSIDKKNFVRLLKELRERFDEEGFLLSAAVAASEESASKSYLIPEVSKYLDFINVMAYDLHGSWETKTGINAPLYTGSWEKGIDRQRSVDSCIKYWISQGAPREKLILGMPFYGRTFTLDNAKNNKIGSPARQGGKGGKYTQEAGHLNYNEFCEQNLEKNKWNIYFQEEQRVPYAVKGNQWIGYDDERSIQEKSEYVIKHGLGGAMVWSIEADDIKGVCGEKYPLLKTINRVLRKHAGNGTTSTTSKPMKSSSTTSKPKKSSTTTSKPKKSSSTTSKSKKSSSTRSPTVTPTTSTLASVSTTSESKIQNGVCMAAGYTRDPHDCSTFYICEANEDGSYEQHPFRCPSELYFDIDLTTCNYQEKVNCKNNNDV